MHSDLIAKMEAPEGRHEAVMDEMIKAGAKAIVACRFEDESEPVSDYDLELSRAAINAALKALEARDG